MYYKIMSNSPFYINNNKQIVFITSPKCACTTLKKYFVNNICNIPAPISYRHLASKTIIECRDYLTIQKDYIIYYFVRDPIERIISLYINKFLYYNNKKLTATTLEGFTTTFLTNINETYENITFNKFLLGIHFDTQVNITNFNIIKDFKQLFIYNINNIPKQFNLEHLNSSKYNNINPYIDITHMTPENITEKDININNFKEDFDLIKRIYNIDYSILSNYVSFTY
jgi:hypothetical protein